MCVCTNTFLFSAPSYSAPFVSAKLTLHFPNVALRCSSGMGSGVVCNKIEMFLPSYEYLSVDGSSVPESVYTWIFRKRENGKTN